MIIPVGDINPRRTVPFINYFLILANVAVYVYYLTTLFRPEPEVVQIVDTHALTPDRWNLRTLFTSMFLHGSAAHLLGNMLFLWIAGDNVEDRLGHLPYLFFYLAAGMAGGVAHIVTATREMSGVPTVGASGAISGVLGAYLVFFPTSRIKFFFWFFVFMRSFTTPSWVAIGFWVALQALMGWQQMKGQTMMVAVFAHLGGFLFGFGVALLLRALSLFKPSRRAS